ncbi:MAG: glycine cleavage system protein GcvH [Bacteroidales bacterium]|jgi:glycine cleavage system H protein|nr:glycine cleavage system protein GcvH [Acholeplasmataceae bacterium]
MILEGLRYQESHEWIKVEGNVGLIGISDFAQHTLGSIVFIELPKVGQTLKKGDTFGAVESVKAASDLYMPVSGKVIEINESLEDTPEAINDDAYANWILKVELSNPEELNSLLDSKQYEPFTEE